MSNKEGQASGSKGRRFKLDTGALREYRQGLEAKSPGTLLEGQGEVAIPIENLVPAPWNARRYFDSRRLSELAGDLKEHGQIHPVLVRPHPGGASPGMYEVVVGERRLRAARLAGLEALRARIRSLSDREARSLSLAENLDRENLSSYEETVGYLQRIALELEGLPEFDSWRKENEDPIEATVRLMHRLHNERRLPPHESGIVRGTPLEAAVRSMFAAHPRISLEAFYKHRLPILRLPEDLLGALRSGALAYSKATLIAKLPEDERRALLAETLERNLSVATLRKRVGKASGRPADNLYRRALLLAGRLKRAGLSQERQERADVLLTAFEELLSAE